MYEFTKRDLLNKPESYYYSKFNHIQFLNDYFNDRSKKIQSLKEPEIVGKESDLLKKWINLNFDEKNYPEVECFSSTKFFKKIVLNNDLDQYKITFHKIIQKFEVTKKIYSDYSIQNTKGIGNFKILKLYILFGICLILFFNQTKKLTYLNSLLKVSDIICSQKIKDLSKMNFGFKFLIKSELLIIKKLLKENRISL